MLKQFILLFAATVAVVIMTACGPTPEDLVKQGKDCMENENYTEALACFQKAAEKGHAEAEYWIGNLYYADSCNMHDSEIAADWYKKAAAKGCGEAQNKLVFMYYIGEGVGEDHEKAAKWAKKALEQDDYWESLMLLGLFYAKGEVVPKDNKKAVEYMQKASDMEIKAKFVVSDILFKLYLEGEEGVQDDEKAISIYCEEHNVDRTMAMNKIGMMYYDGEEIEKAVKWLRKAADEGNADAQCSMGLLYYSGEGVEKDFVVAAKWFELAANADNADAQACLGSMYYMGEGVTRSIDDARFWWQKAADQGHETAKEFLILINLAQEREKAKKNIAETKKNAFFSVSPNKKVVFSKSNLQYQASTNTWRFAENPWDVIQEGNKNISSSYSGWIDLFSWGTGEQPTSTTYYADQFYDWGNNTILNGEGKKWYTLTNDEWNYVLNQRSTKSGIRYAKAVVNNVNGIILLPDNFNNNGIDLKNTNTNNAHFNSNRISNSEWFSKFETIGAVFLPVGCTRMKVNVSLSTVELNFLNKTHGHYWTATDCGIDMCGVPRFAKCIRFDDNSLYSMQSHRWFGYFVRLVRNY